MIKYRDNMNDAAQVSQLEFWLMLASVMLILAVLIRYLFNILS